MDAFNKDIIETEDDVPGGVLPKPSHVIGIGASAGGLEALEELFAFVPRQTGFAFVIVQHLSPDYASKMDQLLSRHTTIPVSTAADGIRLEPDHIYLGVPRHEMIVSGGRLLLSPQSPEEVFTLPIDHFFRSLADDMGQRSVGVVLSGTGSDGTRGAREIRDAGGLVIAQDPETAKFTGMPQSVIESELAHLVLSPEQIPQRVIRHATPEKGVELSQEEPESLTAIERIIAMLKKESGIDFNDYKPSTVMRRIERRLQMSAEEGIDDYASYLDSNPEELNNLYHDLLIGVTRFFRDPEAYDQLKHRVIIPMVRKKAGEPIRLWVAGCATGEEAYSLGILFYEAADELKLPFSAKIFATDVHGASLATANQGEYSEEALETVSEERRGRFFTPVSDDTWRVTKELRTAVVFARHNLLTDAPFTKLDLVTCRNLLIYLQPSAQKRVLGLFHFALATEGHMFLGTSETPGPLSDEFASVEGADKVYKKRRDVRLPVDRRPRISNSPLVRERERGRARLGAGEERRSTDLYARILEDVMPRSILLNEEYRLLHTFAGAEQFLRVPAGRVTSNALELVDPKLRTALSAALQQAAQRQVQVSYSGLPLETPSGDSIEVRLTVRPYSHGEGTRASFLVQFETVEESTGVGEEDLEVEGASTDYVRSLENELRLAQENLQATIEELETSNEELQATNEELVASNEELQSTNEELHSVNEELYTVNTEHQFQIRELTQVTDDLDHLFQNIDVGVLFLDSERRIRKFTTSMGNILHLQANDIGRPFEHFVQNLHNDLRDDVTKAMDCGELIEREVELRTGPICLLRVAPYWVRGQVNGVVISLVDISHLKRSIAAVNSLSSIVAHSTDAIISLGVDGRVLTWNGGAEKMFDISEGEALGEQLSHLIPEEDGRKWEAGRNKVLSGEVVPSFECARRHRTRGKIHSSESLSPLIDERGELAGFGVIIRDITRLKRAEEHVLRAVAQRDQFIAVLSHELRNPLMGIQSALDLLKGEDDKRAHEVLVRQVRQLTRILEDLLDVTRMRRDKVEMRRRNVVLQVVLGDAIAAMRSRIESSEVDFKFECPEEPIVAYADAARLQQLLVNLVGNALKYTSPKHRVKVSLRQDADKALFVVGDDGAGISPDELESIFEPFMQGVDTPKDRDSGMGLGLALARAIARAHGGDVSASSPGKGCGSTFVVSLPTTESSADEPSDVSSQRPSQSNTERRVLLVEDDEDNRSLLEALLEIQGYDVVSCGDGESALDMLKKETFDVAFVDLGLPLKDGFEVARETRKFLSGDSLRLVALTGHGTQKDRRRVQEAGFDEHLVKPVSIETLVKVLES